VVTSASTCDAGAVFADDPVLFVSFNKQLNGFSIQTAVDDCQPAGGWLTVSPGAPAGESWWSCYNPSSPTPAEGGQVVIFRSAGAAVASWDDPSFVEGDGDVVTSYAVSGTIKDRDGQDAAIDVRLDVTPNPGQTGAVTFSAVTDTTLSVDWVASDCSTPATRYRVERAPNVPTTATPPVDAPGAYAQVATGVTALTLAQTGLTADTKYWYRVTPLTSGGVAGASSSAMATTAAPPPPAP
jgi:hypothetical protein